MKIKFYLITLIIIFNLNLKANIFEDIGSAFNKVGDFFVDIGNQIARHLNTKITRGPDYAARKAALESAKAVATAFLTVADEAIRGTMTGAEETAKIAVDAAQGFVSGIGIVTTGALKASAEASKVIIEGVKQGTLLSLNAGQYVITNALNLININEISYSGKLSALAQGKFGNIKVKGAIAGNNFPPLTLNLDINDIFGSIASVATGLASSLKDLINPFAQKAQIVSSGVDQVQKALNQDPTQQFINLDKAMEEVNAKLAQIKQEQETMKLSYSKYMSQAIDVLAKTVKEAGIPTDRDSVVARRVLVERAPEFDALQKQLRDLKTQLQKKV